MINLYEKYNKRIRVDVTREDIDNGIKGQSTSCPIALAVCRALEIPSEEQVIEVDGGIDLPNDDYILIPFQIGLNKSIDLSEFINAFDKEELVFPFSFEIRVDEKEIEFSDEGD